MVFRRSESLVTLVNVLSTTKPPLAIDRVVLRCTLFGSQDCNGTNIKIIPYLMFGLR